jgi:hypothetical protein
MSHLDSFIQRLRAQRSCLEAAIALVSAVPGPVLEIGLGNGRSYDHLRSNLPGRDIFVFDRKLATHPDSTPPADRLLLGEFRDTLALAAARIGRPAALAHVDLGSGNPVTRRAAASLIAAHLAHLLAPGAIVASDQPLDNPDLVALPPPADVARDAYFLYRRNDPR